MVSRNTTLVPSLGLRMGQPVREASALACEGSVCHPKGERKRERAKEQMMMTRSNISMDAQSLQA